jgi:hypothetical protein
LKCKALECSQQTQFRHTRKNSRRKDLRLGDFQNFGLEEELWAMAYGEVWPLIRKALTIQQWSESADQRRTWFFSKQKIGA